MQNLPTSMGPAGTSVDIRDPRIRITFADVAMKLAQDGPAYGALLLVAVLAMTKNIEGIHAIFGAAFALQSRSRPPDSDKLDKVMRGVIALVFIFALAAVTHACK